MGVSLPLRADRLGAVLALSGALALLLALVALVSRRPGPLPWAYAIAGAGYAGFIYLQSGTIDGIAPLYGVALLFSAELAYWTLERPVHGSRPGRRASLIVATCLAGGGVSGLVLTASEVTVRGGLGLEVLGVAAAVAILALLARLARAE